MGLNLLHVKVWKLGAVRKFPVLKVGPQGKEMKQKVEQALEGAAVHSYTVVSLNWGYLCWVIPLKWFLPTLSSLVAIPLVGGVSHVRSCAVEETIIQAGVRSQAVGRMDPFLFDTVFSAIMSLSVIGMNTAWFQEKKKNLYLPML